jgi:hypothetical protein
MQGSWRRRRSGRRAPLCAHLTDPLPHGGSLTASGPRAWQDPRVPMRPPRRANQGAGRGHFSLQIIFYLLDVSTFPAIKVYFQCNAGQLCCESKHDLDFQFDPGHLGRITGSAADLHEESSLHGSVEKLAWSKSISLQIQNSTSASVWIYKRLVEQYSSKQMTQASDAINDISGLLQYLERRCFPEGIVWGIPIQLFGLFLCFRYCGQGRRRPGFPSWSWVGWDGKLELRIYYRSCLRVSVLRDDGIVPTGGALEDGHFDMGWKRSLGTKWYLAVQAMSKPQHAKYNSTISPRSLESDNTILVEGAIFVLKFNRTRRVQLKDVEIRLGSSAAPLKQPAPNCRDKYIVGPNQVVAIMEEESLIVFVTARNQKEWEYFDCAQKTKILS